MNVMNDSMHPYLYHNDGNEVAETYPIEEEIAAQIKASFGSALLYEHIEAVLRVAESGVAISIETRPRIVVGRSDSNGANSIQIDLKPHNARALGVSRRHAILFRMKNALYIADLESSNGTYVNGERLEAKQPRLLHNGDEISFGKLRCYIEFQ
jgi:pSer/pThr/pTyr-binding forkhead associated (FHA) protein